MRKTIMVFLFLAVAVVAVWAVVSWEPREDEPDNGQLVQADGVQQTLLSEFTRLDDLRRKAQEDTSIDLLESVFTTNSPMKQRLETVIERLIKDGIRMQESWAVKEARVSRYSEHSAVITQQGVLDIRFVDVETNQDVTTKGSPENQEIECTLHKKEETWRIHNCIVVASVPVDA